MRSSCSSSISSCFSFSSALAWPSCPSKSAVLSCSAASLTRSVSTTSFVRLSLSDRASTCPSSARRSFRASSFVADRFSVKPLTSSLSSSIFASCSAISSRSSCSVSIACLSWRLYSSASSCMRRSRPSFNPTCFVTSCSSRSIFFSSSLWLSLSISSRSSASCFDMRMASASFFALSTSPSFSASFLSMDLIFKLSSLMSSCRARERLSASLTLSSASTAIAFTSLVMFSLSFVRSSW
mmetsp:Transcript_47876/g.124270  ORF Transcript_47876/g.124270 Transcript_47876/m.124270 type:complete len:239 (-) Transcript_47876:852-1568(-)